MKNKFFLLPFAICILLASCSKKVYFTPPKYEIKSIIPVPRSYWPTYGWKKKLINSKKEIQELESFAFPKYNISTINENAIFTHALLIVKGGHIVYEKYDHGFQRNSSFLLWSISKSITSALYGIALQKQYIRSIDDPVSKYYSPYSSKQKKSITFRNFLNMTSGINWREDYEDKPFFSHAVAMLYTFGRDNVGDFFTQLGLSHKIGEYHHYSTGTTTFLMSLLQKILKEKYHNFAWEELYNPIGMSNMVMETDSQSKTFYGGSYIYASARDLAKFAFLYLNDGMWNNKRILPKDWVNFSRTPPQAKFHYDDTIEDFLYGAHWYLNLPFKNEKPLSGIPAETFFASGHWGQYVFIIPSLDLIVVRMGNDRGDTMNKNLLLEYSIQLSSK